MKYFLVFSLAFLISCQPKPAAVPEINLWEDRPLSENTLLQTIAVGSCNRQDLPQDIWKSILEKKPELWIWLGDNIYGDTEDMEVLKSKYLLQKTNPEYRNLLQHSQVIGIWDDHDYGVNDGDKNYPFREASKMLMLDFLDIQADNPVRTREGAYQSYTFGPEGKKVKIILLDARYFRDTLQATGVDDGNRYFPNETGDILGEAQWEWLESELTQSDAQIHLIGSGIQMIPEEQFFEKWANFPTARKRLFDLINKTKPALPLLLSGDRHIAELSKLPMDSLPQPIFELTASGMTHTWRNMMEESSQYRVGELVVSKNYGLIKIDWSTPTPTITVEVLNPENQPLLTEKIY